MDIPGFQLGRQVADGQFCKGYNALNLSNSKTVNIQVFDSSLISRESFVKQFREVTSLLEDHKFGIMIPILHAVISEKSCYVIYDYFPNPQQIPQLPKDLTSDRMLKLGLQLAQTLDQLHKVGVVHGGIENGSVFLHKDGQPALRPVMMQRVINSLWPMTYDNLESKQMLYLAPEFKVKLTPATDFYALGVLLYQMLFDCPAVDEADCKQMEANLQSIEQMSFDIDGKNLTPLFLRLLSPVAANRIQNLKEYYSALQQCGIELSDIEKTSSSSPSILNSNPAKESANRPALKWFLTAATLLVAVIASMVFFLLPDKAVEVEVAQTNAPVVTASIPEGTGTIETLNQNSAGMTNKPDDVDPQSSESLYQKALSQIESNPGAALMSVSVILRETPDHSGALNLKKQIEQKIEARLLINKAERQLSELKLLKPSGDNAYETYQSLADKLSLDDERVQQGFTQIAAAYYKQAEYLYQQGSLDKAKQNLELGLYVKKGYSPLIDLRLRINEKEKEQKLKIAQLEKSQTIIQQQQLQESQRQKEQQRRELEQQRLSEALTKQREQAQAEAIVLRDRQLAQQQQQLKLRNMNINKLLLSANSYLNRGQLRLDAVFAAHMDYEEIRQLDVENNQVSRLKQDIIYAYSMLAIRDTNDALIQKALQAIQRDVQLSEQDRKKLKVRSRQIR